MRTPTPTLTLTHRFATSVVYTLLGVPWVGDRLYRVVGLDYVHAAYDDVRARRS